jgi:hypothetical protein
MDTDRSQAEHKVEKPEGEIDDNAAVTGADSQQVAGTVEGQVPGTQSTVQTSQTERGKESAEDASGEK